MSSRKESHGFSLIETVVVIAIIAILLAITLPAFFGMKETAADRLVRYSMIKAYKECKISIIRGDQPPRYTVMIGLHRTNGYYKFYQQYDYIPREDGYIPPTKIGNCIGPLGPHRIGVRKINGNNIDGELWLNLDTAEKSEDGGLKWDDQTRKRNPYVYGPMPRLRTSRDYRMQEARRMGWMAWTWDDEYKEERKVSSSMYSK